MSFFQGYRATEGLDQFQEDRQFWVWLAAHKRLKTKDAIYRGQCRKFNITYIAANVMYTLALCTTVFIEGMILPWIISLVITAIFLPYLIIAPFREQAWRNTRVANELKQSPTSV